MTVLVLYDGSSLCHYHGTNIYGSTRLIFKKDSKKASHIKFNITTIHQDILYNCTN